MSTQSAGRSSGKGVPIDIDIILEDFHCNVLEMQTLLFFRDVYFTQKCKIIKHILFSFLSLFLDGREVL